MPKFDPAAESVEFTLLPKADYPFEIVGVDKSLAKGKNTAGCERRDVKLAFYHDTTFTEKLAQWTETFIDHESCAWKYSVLAKCVNAPGLKSDTDFDITPSWIGLRGWCKVSDKPGIQDPEKRFNFVQVFYTDRPKLPRAPKIERSDVPGSKPLPF